MDEKFQSESSGHEKNSTDYGIYEWHWWHNVLVAGIILAIAFVISR
jgi:hypothetical protein